MNIVLCVSHSIPRQIGIVVSEGPVFSILLRSPSYPEDSASTCLRNVDACLTIRQYYHASINDEDTF